LFERASSGLGQVLDVAMVDGVASLLSGVLHLRSLGQWTQGRGANWVQGAAPWYRPYRTSDGAFVTVGPLEPKFYAQLLDRLGLDPAEWPQLDRTCWPALATRLERIFEARSQDTWRRALEGTDVCFAAALSIDDAAAHPHLAERGTYVCGEDGTPEPGVVPRFGRTPGRVSPRSAPAASQRTGAEAGRSAG
jgi:alpha-methylacyl-CoA racemase